MLLQKIETKIYEVRGIKVMLDFDLAELYEVETLFGLAKAGIRCTYVQ